MEADETDDDARYAAYRDELEREHLPHAIRNAAVVVCVLNNAFVFLDAYAFGESFWSFFAARMLLNLLLVGVYAIGSRRSPAWSPAILCLGTGLLLLYVIIGAGAPMDDYYVGLVLAFVGLPVLLPIAPLHLGAVWAVMILAYAASAFGYDGTIDWQTYGIHNLFLASAAAVGVFSCLRLDHGRFRDFLQRREIEQARDRLAALDVAKNRFTANVHHELRTPLTLMLAPIEGMLSGDFGDVPAALLSYLKTMHVNGLRLLKLINNLLDLAKVESEQIRIRRRVLDLARLVEEIVTGARAMAERKGVTLTTDCEPAPRAPLHADPDAVEKVLVNLLGNALKFTPSGGAIEITARNEGEGVHVCVKDSGIGIPPDQLDRIFDRFAQVDGSATRQFEGTGIGLSLAQELTQLHGGRIWAESAGEGRGSAMHVFLPWGEPDAEEAEEVIATDDGRALALERSFRSLAAEDTHSEESEQYRVVELQRSVERWEGGTQPPASEQAEVQARDEPDPRAEIVLAEDNPDMRTLLTDLLSSEYRVRATRNGREALEAVRERQPRLVLTDVMMPEMTGIELCRAIKDDPALSGIPVVLVTSKAEREMKIDGLEAGADDYVTKPFHPRELLARVRSFVRLRLLQEELAARNVELTDALADLREAQGQLVHREKMASLGQLVAGVAHEINNPVNFIQGNLFYLREYTDALAAVVCGYEQALAEAEPALRQRCAALRREADLDGVLGDLDSVFAGCKEGVERTIQIVSDLRTFSRADHSEVLQVDLHESLDSTLNLLRDRLSGVEVVRSYGAIGPVECLAGQINQVFMNLLANAADAMADEGRLEIRTEPLAGDAVAIEIEDSGAGIDPEQLERIFDPFFTTKAPGKGTGLGLSLSYGIVERHGGTIRARSEPGQGTCFRIELPLVMRAQSEDAARPPTASEAAGSEPVADPAP